MDKVADDSLFSRHKSDRKEEVSRNINNGREKRGRAIFGLLVWLDLKHQPRRKNNL